MSAAHESAALVSDRKTYGNAAIAAVQVKKNERKKIHRCLQQSLLWQCEANNPTDRIKPDALRRAFQALLTRYGSGKRPVKFEPHNPQLSG